MNNQERKGFTKTSRVYVCGCCGRKTRSVGNGDNENVGLCVECYEIGGIENEIADGCCPVSEEESIAEIKILAERIAKLGGKAYSEYL